MKPVDSKITGWQGATLVGVLALIGLLGCGVDESCNNCPLGCCRQGACVLPAQQNDQVCGAGGAVCQACTPGQTCNTSTGQCAIGGAAVPQCNPACNPTTEICAVDPTTQQPRCQLKQQITQPPQCVAGMCLDPLTQTCVAAGQPCSGSNQTCTNGFCQTPTTPTNSCAGCMQPGVGQQCCHPSTQSCVLGLGDPQACGLGGTCNVCAGGQVCKQGACVDPVTNCESSCDGCCTASGECRKLGEHGSNTVTDTQCGKAAGTCVNCYDVGGTCDKTQGQCTRGTQNWSLCLKSVQLEPTTGFGTCSFSDVFFKLSAGTGAPVETPVFGKDLFGGPTITNLRYLNSCIHNITQEQLAQWGVTLQAWDHQWIGNNDYIGSCGRKIGPYELGYGQQDLPLSGTDPLRGGSVCDGCVNSVVIELVPTR